MGELYQKNQHYAKTDANFDKKWFEFDLTYFIMRGLNRIGIIRLVPVEIPVQVIIPVEKVA